MSRRVVFKFRLYVVRDAPSSMQALANLTALCRERLAGRHKIEVVDVFQSPERALADGIILTPTLLRLMPTPLRTIVGALTGPQDLAHVLGLAPPPA